jgi:hypothetical protein
MGRWGSRPPDMEINYEFTEYASWAADQERLSSLGGLA